MFVLNKDANMFNNFSEHFKQMFLVSVYIITWDKAQWTEKMFYYWCNHETLKIEENKNCFLDFVWICFFFCLGIQLTENKHINIYFIRISLELFQGCWYQQRHTYYKDRLHLNSPYLHENILKYIKSCEPWQIFNTRFNSIQIDRIY